MRRARRPRRPRAANGRRLAIHFAVLPAETAAPAPDPLFVFAGGPGQGARTYAALFARIFGTIRNERDLVFVDFRGTGDSGPLQCADQDTHRERSADSGTCRPPR